VSTFTVYWALVLGIIFMLVIFFLPNGVLGWIEDIFKRKTKLAEAKE
jgi:ABC-type branched-subunit amino acid transport system permease subunit